VDQVEGNPLERNDAGKARFPAQPESHVQDNDSKKI
jgi:hypothetical protein